MRAISKEVKETRLAEPPTEGGKGRTAHAAGYGRSGVIEMRSDDRPRELAAHPAAAGGCRREQEIWRAVTLEATAEERRTLVEHLGSCAACAETWRLAVEFAAGTEPRTPERRPIIGLPHLVGGAALLVAAAGVSWIVLSRDTDRQAAVSATRPIIRSLIGDGAPLPREEFRLRWTPGPQGTLYDIEVGTADVKALAQGVALAEPVHLVPEDVLKDLAPGTSIAWRVHARLPDGSVADSVTHFNDVR